MLMNGHCSHLKHLTFGRAVTKLAVRFDWPHVVVDDRNFALFADDPDAVADDSLAMRPLTTVCDWFALSISDLIGGSALISSCRPTEWWFARDGTKFALCVGICTNTLGNIIFSFVFVLQMLLFMFANKTRVDYFSRTDVIIRGKPFLCYFIMRAATNIFCTKFKLNVHINFK